MREKSHVNCNGGTSGGKSPLLTPLCYYRGAVACGVADVDGGVVFVNWSPSCRAGPTFD